MEVIQSENTLNEIVFLCADSDQNSGRQRPSTPNCSLNNVKEVKPQYNPINKKEKKWFLSLNCEYACSNHFFPFFFRQIHTVCSCFPPHLFHLPPLQYEKKKKRVHTSWTMSKWEWWDNSSPVCPPLYSTHTFRNQEFLFIGQARPH